MRNIGIPLSPDEVKDLISIITAGALRIRAFKMSPEKRCRMYEQQMSCLQIIDSMPDVVRKEMQRAKEALELENKNVNHKHG